MSQQFEPEPAIWQLIEVSGTGLFSIISADQAFSDADAIWAARNAAGQGSTAALRAVMQHQRDEKPLAMLQWLSQRNSRKRPHSQRRHVTGPFAQRGIWEDSANDD